MLALRTNWQESAEKNDDGLIDCAAHCDAFWFWLKSKGINSYRRCVAYDLLHEWYHVDSLINHVPACIAVAWSWRSPKR